MNSGVTAERIYDGLKRRLLAGDILPGDKLEPARIADDLGSSVTPVRDALHRLVGERLVETRTGDGFHQPFMTEPALRDLYEWQGQILQLAVSRWPRSAADRPLDALPVDLGRATPSFFEAVAQRSENSEHRRQILASNDRLATARVAEARVLNDLEDELRALVVTCDNEPRAVLLRRIAAYQRRRTRAVSAIVRAMYRPVDTAPSNIRDIDAL